LVDLRKNGERQIRKDLNLPLETAERVAKDREAWKRLTDGNGAKILRRLCR